MLVFVSDLHLYDNPANTLSPRMTERFLRKSLIPQIRDARASEVTVVFVGDLVDINRSTYWVDGRSGGYKPWSHWTSALEKLEGRSTDESAPGFAPHMMEADILRVVDGTVAANQGTFRLWREFKRLSNTLWDDVTFRPDVIQFEYLPGNHDRLIQFSPATREALIKAIDLDHPDPHQPFPWLGIYPDYAAAACHGHLIDPQNVSRVDEVLKDPISSPWYEMPALGDAFTITFGVSIVYRFEQFLRESLIPYEPGLVSSLADIDLVRPQQDMINWIKRWGLAQKNDVAAELDKIVSGLISEFLHNDFVQWCLNHGPIVKAILKLGIGLPKDMERAMLELTKRQKAEQHIERRDIVAEALTTGALGRWLKTEHPDIRYFIAGHTHNPIVLPLAGTTGSAPTSERYYFNTGSWLDVIEAGTTSPSGFARRHQMSHLSFYREGEDVYSDGSRRSYWEFWGGFLREGPA